jgi:hypothetical protein
MKFMKKSHRITVFSIFLALFFLNTLPYSSASSLELLENTDRCIYDETIEKDYCYSIYKFCDNSFNPSMVNFIFKKGNEQEYKRALKDLDFETEVENLGDKCYKVKIEAHKNPYQDIDNIFCYDETCFYEFVWWNSSYPYKFEINASCPDCNISITMPILINGTDGVNINGYNQLLWCNYTVTNITDTIGYLYFKNETDYRCIDETETYAVEMIVDEGNTTDYLDFGNELLFFITMNDTNEKSIYSRTIGNVNSVIVSGKIGKARDFNGNAYIWMPNSDQFEGFCNLTISFWIWFDTIEGTGNENILGIAPDGGIYNMFWDTSGGNLRFYYSGDITEGGVTYSSFSRTGEWVHMAGTYDCSDLIMYIDGKEYDRTTTDFGNLADVTGDFFIGAREGSPADRYIDAKIDNIMYWNRTFPPDKISFLYNTTDPRNFATGETIYNDTISPIITFVPPTPNNEIITVNFTTINITGNEDLTNCKLNWNGINETMINITSKNYILNKVNLSDGNYTFYVFCNDTSNNTGFSEIRWVYVSILPTIGVLNISLVFDISRDLPIQRKYCQNSVLVTFRERVSCSSAGCQTVNQTDMTICAVGCEENLSIYGAECIPQTFNTFVIGWSLFIISFVALMFITHNIKRKKKGKQRWL